MRASASGIALPQDIEVSFADPLSARTPSTSVATSLDLLGTDVQLVFSHKNTNALGIDAVSLLLAGSGILLLVMLVSYVFESRRNRIAQETIAKQEAALTKQGQLSILGELSTTLAHELNQPLATIANFVAACEMRVKSQGITGVNYVELDYVRDMGNYKTLPYNWKPQYLVIDALPSQTDIFFSGVRKVLDNLGEMNLAETQKKFDVLLTNLNTIIGGDGNNNTGIAKSVERLNVLLGRIDEVANKTELELLMREVIATTVILRQTLSSMQGDTISSIDNLKQITDQLNDFAKVASRYPSSMVWGEPPPRITLPQTGAQP